MRPIDVREAFEAAATARELQPALEPGFELIRDRLSYLAGLRVGEIAALTVRDVIDSKIREQLRYGRKSPRAATAASPVSTGRLPIAVGAGLSPGSRIPMPARRSS